MHTLYVANNTNSEFAGTVSVINTATCNGATTAGCSGPMPTVLVGRSSRLVAVDTTTNRIFVTNISSASVSVINGTACNAEATSGCAQPASHQAVGCSRTGSSSTTAPTPCTRSPYSEPERRRSSEGRRRTNHRRTLPCQSRTRRIPAIEHHVAQLNIGRAKGPMDGPVMAAFKAALEPINALADEAPGFVWRLQTGDGDATAIRPYEDERMMVNMSVWESIEALRAFVYTSGHTLVMRNRQRWFEKFETYLVLWWVPAGYEPTIEEAKERLEHLKRHGPTPYAFTFRASFRALDVDPDAALIDDEVGCSA